MKNKTNLILKQVLDRVRPPKEDLKKISLSIGDFKEKARKRIKALKANAEIFIGGSYAKNTLIKKDNYDIDIFIRFDEKENNISEITQNIIKDFDFEIVHGSRDYFRINSGDGIFLEIVPVKKTKNPVKAENITDLSYFHVKYINKKLKNSKILDEIMIAKAFCYANGTYGAESYVQGFSGYALELLICHYKGFKNFLKAVSKIDKKDKIVIDIEKHYKNKNQVMLDINSSKLISPIILIDPTYKQRNAIAALSYETLDKLKKSAKEFLKNPTIKAFEREKTDLTKIRDGANKNGYEFILIEADTDRQAGDIAGSKLLKFYRHITEEISKFFTIKSQGFNYDKEKTARYFFVAEKKGKIILDGPKLDDRKNLLRFRKKHKNVFTGKGRIYAREEIKLSIKQFIEAWKKKHSIKISEMNIKKLKVIN